MSEISSHHPRIRWRLGIYATLAMSFLALLPQIHLWAVRGNGWQGSYVSFDFDEVAYSTYINALISGRPRRSDPYSGRDDAPNNPQPESSHSIQFLPAYAVAIPARVFGLSAATTFIVIRALAAMAATLALFWLFALLLGDARVAAAGAIIVLCLGGVAGEPHDAWRIITFRGLGETLPFLRRYVPALVFSFFFIFVALVWQALNSEDKTNRLLRALLAGLTLAILVFSYFFLWTTAIAWLFAVALLWLIAHREAWQKLISVLGIITACFALAMVPYAFLLSRRAPSMDEAQLLTRSHSVVVSLPVIIGLVVLLALVVAVWRRRLTWPDPSVLFAASFALLPVITFNQQVVSGLLLQPVHYGRYSANYVCVLAAVLGFALMWRGQKSHRQLPSHALGLIAILVFSWSLVENGVRAHRMGSLNNARDDAQRVAWRLLELSKSLHNYPPDQPVPVVLSTDLLLADSLPNVAPQPILWAPHLFVFSGSTATENRERLYRQLYYSGVNEAHFGELAGHSSLLQLALFGWERMNQKPYAPPITEADVQKETQLYKDYVANFSTSQAGAPLLEYVIVPTQGGPSLANLDRWYRRDAGELVGNYTLYRMQLK